MVLRSIVFVYSKNSLCKFYNLFFVKANVIFKIDLNPNVKRHYLLFKIVI